MLADLGGINMKWDETRQVAQVQFAKWPEQWKTCIGPATMELYCVAAQSVVRTEKASALSDAACDVLSTPGVDQVLSEAFVFTQVIDQPGAPAGPDPSEAFMPFSGHENLLENEEDELLTTEVDCFEDCPRPVIRATAESDGRPRGTMTVLLDSGADVDLISEKAAGAFRGKWVALRERANGSQSRGSTPSLSP